MLDQYRTHLLLSNIFLHNIIMVNILAMSAPNKPNKISNWDHQRAEWLKKNPNFPNFINPNKPRVLLVTGSPPQPSKNAAKDRHLLKSIKNKIDYCRIHGIEIFYNMALLDEAAGDGQKLPLIRKLLQSHPEFEFFWWLDSAAMFTDMAFEVPWERYKDANFIINGRNKTAKNQNRWLGLNAGSFLLRNCQWALDLLDAWARATMDPKGKKITQPVDDQSGALVFMLATQSKWGDKVYIESEYYHPGFGHDRWPFVTDFVGCESGGDERCLNQMDRAFNFGDNQVLLIYGFRHESLGGEVVKRVRNESSNPLELNSEVGLLHHAFKSC